MTDTPTSHPPGATDLFLNLIVAFLAPMFLTAGNGDLTYARAAAIETVNSYRAQTQMDLLLVAQVIAFGLAALGSLCLSMADDISLSMTLRLRANAVAANRAGEQCRRALVQARPDTAAQAHPEPAPPALSDRDDGFPDAAAIAAGVAQAQQRAAQANARLRAPRPPAPPEPDPVTDDEQRRTLWAAGMADVAAELLAGLSSLPPAERRAATIRAAALNGVANELLAGHDGQLPPPFNLHHPG